MALTQVSTNGITDGTIVNADVGGSAAIAVSKLADFTANDANNRVLTATGTKNSYNGEANLTFDGNLLHLNSGSGGLPKIRVQHTGAGNDVFWIYEDGDMYNVNGTFAQSSDIKLKENVVDAPSQWADIKALKVRKFNFKESTGLSTHTQIGMVAQEVETTCPGLISERVDLQKSDTKNELGVYPETDTGEKTKSIKLTVLYMKAVKALQESMTRIETLETKVAALESA